MTSTHTQQPAAAHSILPLAVLEAMRSLDSPSDEEAAEYVDELLKKRLGISDTVLAQINRYERAVKRDDSVSGAEFDQILRLAGRRTDAALVFAEGGRRAARRAIRRMSPLRRWAVRMLPRVLSRGMGLGAARSASREVLGVTLARDRVAVLVLSNDSASVRATPDGAACSFFGSAVAELLRQLAEFDGAVTHTRCRARGDSWCEWQAT